MLKSKWFDYSFVVLGLLIQVVVYAVTLHLPAADFSSLRSVLSVVVWVYAPYGSRRSAIYGCTSSVLDR